MRATTQAQADEASSISYTRNDCSRYTDAYESEAKSHNQSGPCLG